MENRNNPLESLEFFFYCQGNWSFTEFWGVWGSSGYEPRFNLLLLPGAHDQIRNSHCSWNFNTSSSDYDDRDLFGRKEALCESESQKIKSIGLRFLPIGSKYLNPVLKDSKRQISLSDLFADPKKLK